MKLYVISVILSIFIALALGVNKYFSIKKQLFEKDISQMKKNEKVFLELRNKYYELKEFISKENIYPLKKEIAYKKMLELLESYKKEFGIEILQQSEKIGYFEVKFNFEEKFKEKEKLKKFFYTLFNTKFLIPYIENFEYKTTERGTIIKSLVKINVPYME